MDAKSYLQLVTALTKRAFLLPKSEAVEITDDVLVEQLSARTELPAEGENLFGRAFVLILLFSTLPL